MIQILSKPAENTGMTQYYVYACAEHNKKAILCIDKHIKTSGPSAQHSER